MMSRTQRTQSAARQTGARAEGGGQKVENSTGFAVLVTVGLIAYGVVHLLVAWITIQLAWTGTSHQASQQGAFQEMASTPAGDVLLWITATGLCVLSLWQILQAAWGHHDAPRGRERIGKRIGSVAKAVVYLALGISAASSAARSGSSRNSNTSEKTLTAKLLSVPFGRTLVVLVGVTVIVVAGWLVYQGISKKFTDDLTGGVGAGVIRLGRIGHVAKGIALGIVGVLFVVAAATLNPQEAGGMDTALRTLRDQSFGRYLLTLMAIGLACFAAYCFAWSRHAKKG